MRLSTAHRILIGSSIGLAVIFSAWSVLQYMGTGTSTYAIVGGLSLVTGCALTLYLRRFNAGLRAQNKPKNGSTKPN